LNSLSHFFLKTLMNFLISAN